MQKAQQKPQTVVLRQEIRQALPIEFIKRIELCRDTTRSNCVGTALYIVGEILEDTSVSPVPNTKNSYDLYLSTLGELQVPVVGCLITWKRRMYAFEECGPKIIRHAGVVTSLDPILVTHRAGTHCELIENQPLYELQERYKESNLFDPLLVYYLPRALIKQ